MTTAQHVHTTTVMMSHIVLLLVNFTIAYALSSSPSFSSYREAFFSTASKYLIYIVKSIYTYTNSVTRRSSKKKQSNRDRNIKTATNSDGTINNSSSSSNPSSSSSSSFIQSFNSFEVDASSLMVYNILSSTLIHTPSAYRRDFVVPMNIELVRHLQSSTQHPHVNTLVLDLDETLIHSTIAAANKLIIDYDFIVRDDKYNDFLCYKRPYLSLFLSTLSHFYTLNCFTASYSCYSDPILDQIDPFNLLTRRLYNTDLRSTGNNGYEKDLSVVTAVDALNRVLMIDNSPNACKKCRDNLYVIPSFKADDSNDTSLLSLIPLLLALSKGVDDVREIVTRVATTTAQDN